MHGSGVRSKRHFQGRGPTLRFRVHSPRRKTLLTTTLTPPPPLQRITEIRKKARTKTGGNLAASGAMAKIKHGMGAGNMAKKQYTAVRSEQMKQSWVEDTVGERSQDGPVADVGMNETVSTVMQMLRRSEHLHGTWSHIYRTNQAAQGLEGNKNKSGFMANMRTACRETQWTKTSPLEVQGHGPHLAIGRRTVDVARNQKKKQ